MELAQTIFEFHGTLEQAHQPRISPDDARIIIGDEWSARQLLFPARTRFHDALSNMSRLHNAARSAMASPQLSFDVGSAPLNPAARVILPLKPLLMPRPHQSL
jgi:hypothetical protein